MSSATAPARGRAQALPGRGRVPVLLAGDGAQWVKYGEKRLVGPARTRLYFRCTGSKATQSRCCTRKYVDMLSGGQVAAIAYSGEHNHELQPLEDEEEPSAHITSAPSQPVQAKASEQSLRDLPTHRAVNLSCPRESTLGHDPACFGARGLSSHFALPFNAPATRDVRARSLSDDITLSAEEQCLPPLDRLAVPALSKRKQLLPVSCQPSKKGRPEDTLFGCESFCSTIQVPEDALFGCEQGGASPELSLRAHFGRNRDPGLPAYPGKVWMQGTEVIREPTEHPACAPPTYPWTAARRNRDPDPAPPVSPWTAAACPKHLVATPASPAVGFVLMQLAKATPSQGCIQNKGHTTALKAANGHSKGVQEQLLLQKHARSGSSGDALSSYSQGTQNSITGNMNEAPHGHFQRRPQHYLDCYVQSEQSLQDAPQGRKGTVPRSLPHLDEHPIATGLSLSQREPSCDDQVWFPDAHWSQKWLASCNHPLTVEGLSEEPSGDDDSRIASEKLHPGLARCNHPLTAEALSEEPSGDDAQVFHLRRSGDACQQNAHLSSTKDSDLPLLQCIPQKDERRTAKAMVQVEKSLNLLLDTLSPMLEETESVKLLSTLISCLSEEKT